MLCTLDLQALEVLPGRAVLAAERLDESRGRNVQAMRKLGHPWRRGLCETFFGICPDEPEQLRPRGRPSGQSHV